MNTVLLYREDPQNREELEIARKYFPVIHQRNAIKDSLVVGRYSVLPYYKELTEDLRLNNSRLLNSHSEHLYVADFEYYHHIEKFTPKTYFGEWHRLPEGRYVVKGLTNSRKFEWKTKMFAENKKQAVQIALDLMNDFMISEQGIIIREYEDFEIVEHGITGMPFLNEHRFFFLGKQMLSNGFYWSISEKIGEINQEGIDFAQKIANIVSEYVNFFVIDIAKKPNGEWRVIELNDGQMSGLSLNDPEVLYANLAAAIKKR